MITHKEFKDLLDGGILKSAGLILTLEERRLVGNSLKDGQETQALTRMSLNENETRF